MRGTSLHWFRDAVGDIWGSFRRSFVLGLMVMVTTVVLSVMGGLAFRKKFKGSSILFYMIITSLVIPSILISLGVGLIFSQSGLNVHWSTSGFGSQLTWTLPFGLLIMLAVFNRFDKSYEEDAREDGIRSVVLRCGGMVDIERGSTHSSQVRLIDGVRAAAALASQL